MVGSRLGGAVFATLVPHLNKASPDCGIGSSQLRSELLGPVRPLLGGYGQAAVQSAARA